MMENQTEKNMEHLNGNCGYLGVHRENSQYYGSRFHIALCYIATEGLK